MPAEWEPHEATWLSWPHEKTDWPGKFAPIPWVYAEIVRNLARVERVRILVMDAAAENDAKKILTKAGADLKAVDFYRVPTDRGWIRDFGPIFVRGKNSELSATHWLFNAWAKYDNGKRDAAAVTKLAPQMKSWKIPVHQPMYKGKRVVLEGGGIEVNGRGTIMITEEWLLSSTQVRNPGFTRADTEAVLRQGLGVKNIVWLGKGIAGDDTHGHVDDLCRFVNPRTVVLVREKNQRDANYKPLEENWERLRSARLEDGSKMEVVEMPMPAPLHFEGVRLPASYANFYISNSAVLVPTFNDPNDRVALGILSELFPGRALVGIHAVDLVWGFGTLHCLTQQQPAR